MATKRGKVMTYEGLQLIKLLDLSIMLFCVVTWHIKYFISPLALDQWSPNVARWWLTVKGFHPKIHIILYTCFHERSRDKLTYLHYAVLLVTRLIRVVTYRKEFPPINLHDPSTQWGGHLWEVTWQIKYISRPPEDSWTST